MDDAGDVTFNGRSVDLHLVNVLADTPASHPPKCWSALATTEETRVVVVARFVVDTDSTSVDVAGVDD